MLAYITRRLIQTALILLGMTVAAIEFLVRAAVDLRSALSGRKTT